MLKMNKIKIWSTFLVFFNFSAFASDIHQADSYFEQHQYKLAFNEYLSVAESNKPEAFYQLGLIYYKGLGVAKDEIKALVWFSLAAKHNYDNAQIIVDNLFKHANEEDKDKLDEQVVFIEKKLQKKMLYRNYLPEINNNNLHQKVRFGAEDVLDPAELIEEVEELGLDTYTTNFDAESGEVTNNFDQQDFSTPFYLITEYDVAPDGSIRNIIPIHSSGEIKYALFDLAKTQIAKPEFKQKGTHFTSRSYFGIANYNKYRMRRRHERFYKTLKKQKNLLKLSQEPIDKYRYAMMLTTFPWLKSEDEQPIIILKQAAEYGYPLAEYQYGLKIYQQQSEPQQGIYWISKAAKSGVKQAQYRLGTLLKHSPWIIEDEKKSLFWFEEAASQGHIIAKQKSAEIKLLAKDKQLHDVDGAIIYLAEVYKQQNEEPQYQYLKAMAYAKKENRELPKAVQHIRRAINFGKSLNWDVTEWQTQLNKWTSGGRVTIQDN